MSTDNGPRIALALAALEKQRRSLQLLDQEYYTEYDMAFNGRGAIVSLQRWADRTFKTISENVGPSEAMKFNNVLIGAPKIRGGWDFRETIMQLESFLQNLAQDIEENPDDADFERINPTSDDVAEEKVPPTKYDVFLSYSVQDKDEAREIYKWLNGAGKKCFLAEKALQPGDDFEDRIRDALAGSNEVWILVSPESIRSEWVLRETSAAWALRKKTIPILLRCDHKQLPAAVTSKHAIDYHKVQAYVADL